MVKDDYHKVLLVHIPKTGGASLRSLFKFTAENDWNFHMPITSKIADKYKDYHKFTIVRNSWELCASCYRFEKMNKPKVNFMPYPNMSFYDWLMWKSEFKKPNHYPFPRQLEFIKENDTILVDQIIDHNNYKREVSKLCEKYEIKFNNSKVHNYGLYDYREIFKDDKDIEAVMEICKEDIQYFNYKFE